MPKQSFHWQKKQAASRSDLVIRSGLPQWIIRVLRQGGVKRMSLLARLSDDEVLCIPGIGLRSLAIIRAELVQHQRPASDSRDRGGSSLPELDHPAMRSGMDAEALASTDL